ncbi:MAG: hypothetical protein KY456_01650 [Chloroflexi bacterium]|nr:hypothetical protein [Chloroflexota bacterium]
MSRLIPSALIAVTLSTRKMLMPASLAQDSAAAAGVDGLDIDATSTVGAWLATRLRESVTNSVPVRSVWLSAEDLHSARSRRVLELITQRQPEARPLIVAVLPGAYSLRDLTRTFAPGRLNSQQWPVALGLPSPALRGGRPHLVQLGGIRRFAEEWDLSVAVDLSGQFDPTWEAEAAISRLGDRLSVLRITAAAPSRTAVGRDRVACRALHAAIDRDQELDIAVTAVKSVPFPITPRVASYGTGRAMDYITERAAIHAEALRDGISRFEGSSFSRGN